MKCNKISNFINSEFQNWIEQIKRQIRSTQVKAALHVNTELLQMYWKLGAQIVEKQQTARWGDGFLQKLSNELLREFPHLKGFSLRGLQQIRKWYIFYNQNNMIAKQLVSQLGNRFFEVPWGHHIYILQKCKNIDCAIFYLTQVVEQNWSRNVLLNFLDTNLYERQGKAVTNFSKALPDPQGDLAQQLTRDPYIFDLMGFTEPFREREMEDALVNNISRFLLELGKGFAYVGRQVPLTIGDDILYADLLLYNIELHAYVVVELKVGKFDPAYLGQLSAYVSAIDHIKRTANDSPTIGLLICKTKNDVLARWTLENIVQPLGVSSFEMMDILPKNYQSSLPTIEEIESSLKDDFATENEPANKKQA